MSQRPVSHRPALSGLALCLVLCPLLSGPPAAAQEPGATEGFDPGRVHPDAPPETAQFGRLAGIWDVEMDVRRPDGSWSEEPLVAEWRFRYVLDGFAVQDDWYAPPPGAPAGDGPSQRGTNLRIYDPEAERWEVAYASNTQKQLSTFEARAEGEDRIVMTGLHASGHSSRTTFYDVTAESFAWMMEFQGLGEDPEAWTEVARVRAVRRE